MHRGIAFLVPVVLSGALVRSEAAEFIGSAVYDITIGLSYTVQSSAYGEQGGLDRYTAVGRFENVKFGPSMSPAFEAWFEVPIEDAGTGGVLPMTQINGTGQILDFELSPAWEDPEEAIAGRVTSGPREFTPVLMLVTFEMAHSEEYGQPEAQEDMSLVPLVPTLWFRYWENYSITDPELCWEYEGFAIAEIGSSGLFFSVPLYKLSEGEDFVLSRPLSGCPEAGEWTVQFRARPE